MEKIKEIPSTRELALEWWNSLPDFSRGGISKNGYCVVFFTQPRNHKTLTGREIEEIWRKETKPVYLQIIDTIGGEEKFCELAGIKSNKKQYKEFSPELFKAYISKFSDDDKLKAYAILELEIPWEMLFNRELKKLEE